MKKYTREEVESIIKLVFRDISESNNWESNAEDWIQFELKEHYNMKEPSKHELNMVIALLCITAVLIALIIRV
tara:strand:+ start:220 stop:438 length:219 start_codon:yes stop_codon:yes gene_type:complete